MDQLQRLTERIGRFFLRHWMSVFLFVLAALLVSVLATGIKSEQVKQSADKAVKETVLTKKQVKAKDKTIRALKDSIETTQVIIETILESRDNALVVARQEEARADSLLKPILHENAVADDDATPTGLARALAKYRPQAYELGGDSIR